MRRPNLIKVNKITILSAIARILDPLGIVAPVLIELRIAFQSLWARGMDWDTVLEVKEADVWKTKIKSLELLKEVQIIRLLRPKNVVGRPEIHGFDDGGELAYGACVFVRWRLRDGSFELRFIAAKSYVAPIRIKSIPRIELNLLLIMT
ncbi:uncharacterized protein [Lepeophtheirus salmonis]|uniref:uncharacterized protein n=1 Tax=Lepeophtheirus salmonis TaxID=72036 RepID=UPI003AF3FEA6